jgi:ABC-type transport system involved in cytochrome bd biosynthesis fused ATPase/permease subunit
MVVVQLGLVDLTAAITVALTLPHIPVFMSLVGRTTEASNRSRWDRNEAAESWPCAAVLMVRQELPFV